MNRAIRSLLTVLQLSLFVSAGYTQTKLGLNDALQIARLNSVDYHSAKTDFLSEYWNYKLSKMSLFPKVNFNATPASINRSLTERYDFDNNIEIYRETQMLSSNASLSITQPIALTGGNISVSSNISRLSNFGGVNIVSYSASPFRLSYSQPLFAHNSFRWDKAVLPFKLLIAEQKLLHSEQSLNVNVVHLYFNLLKAFKLKELAEKDAANSRVMYGSGIQQLKLNVITQNYLVDLELNKANAEIALSETNKELNNANYELKRVLRSENITEIEPVVNGIFPIRIVSADELLEMARQSNPVYTEMEEEKITLNRTIDQIKKQNGFSANLNFSYGLNQSGPRFNDVFQNPLNQETGSLSFSVPLLDWGSGRGHLIIALQNKENAQLRSEERIADFEQKLILLVLDFNLQSEIIKSSLEAKDLSAKSYEIKIQQFALGKTTLLELNNAQLKMYKASENYIESIAVYWSIFYELQKITLHDLVTGEELFTDYEGITEILDR